LACVLTRNLGVLRLGTAAAVNARGYNNQPIRFQQRGGFFVLLEERYA